jgi:NAD-dependent DNA ligase
MSVNIDTLKKAEEAYFLTGKPILDDDEYDVLAEAAAREGGGPRPVGARPIAKDACLLPVPMPSLRKVKPGMMRDWEGKTVVVSEKLDGISALWCLPEGRLFLRGDQQYGVEKTTFVPFIGGLARPAGQWIVRGEIVVTKNNSADRNIINGYLHRVDPVKDCVPVGVMKFVGYSICSVNSGVPSRYDAFKMMAAAGFEVAWNTRVIGITEKWLMEKLQKRRDEGGYAIDGLVVGETGVPVVCGATDAYPSDAVAFKMPMADQLAQTRVVEIDWNLGRAGVWTPRLRIEPVVIGGARIEWVTGHNAAWIRDRGLGVGAEVIVRRSGDVIPIIDSVMRSVAVAVWPSGARWESVHLVQDRVESLVHVAHAVELLGVKQCGEERLRALGVGTLKDLFALPESAWAAGVGPGIGPKLWTDLQKRGREADEVVRIMAYPYLPGAVGKKRIQVWAEWVQSGAAGRPAGWGQETWDEFQAELPKIRQWISVSFPAGCAPRNASVVKSAAQPAAAPLVVNGKQSWMTLTGFRNAELKVAAEARGWIVGDLCKKTTHLVIKDASYENKKTEKARADGIVIWTEAEAIANTKTK